MTLIRAEGLEVRYGRQRVLYGVDLALARAEVVTVVGPNGSGKSTLLRALIGAVRPAAGRVWRAPGVVIGYVPQRLQLDPTLPMTVERFLRLPRPHRPAGAIAAALDQVEAGSLAERQMSELSGGQFQRVLVARALLRGPHVLLLDEPTQSLDQPGVSHFYALIDRVRRQTGSAVLMVSHDLMVVMKSSDRVICLNGHICCQGTPTTVSAAPEYRALFGATDGGVLALYRHTHDHDHDDSHDHDHDHGLQRAGAGDRV